MVAARGARGAEVKATTNVVLSRTLSGFAILPTAISPNGDGRADSLTASFSLSLSALANVSIRRGTAGVVSVFDSLLPLGPHTITWPGGVRDGVYSVVLTVTDATGPVSQLLPVRVDRVKPRLKVVNKRPLRISLSEPARVTFTADGVTTTVLRRKAGIFTVVLGRPFARLDAFAEDGALNVGPRIRLR